MDEAIDVGLQKQLFLDRRWLASSYGVRLCVNPPVKRERVLLADRPWENFGIHAYSTVLEDDGTYKLWYDAISRGFDVKPENRKICYATSADGVHWEKPSLRLFEWEGRKENNIVMPGCNGSVMIDPNGPDEHRYKGLMIIKENALWPESKGAICGEYGDGLYMKLYLCTSPDGIHWKRHEPEALPFFHDTQNQLFYDRRIGRYVAYLRWGGPRGRAVARTELDDPMQLPWPYRTDTEVARGPDGAVRGKGTGVELPTVIASDETDPPNTDLYTPCVVQYPWAGDAYFSFTTPYRHYPVGDTEDTAAYGKDHRGRFRNDGPVEVQLAVSSDGINWSRPDRKPYVPLGIAGEWDGGQTYMVLGMLRKGNEMWQYYAGTEYTHGAYDASQTDAHGGICRLVQRLDGFISADADYTGAEFTTPLLKFSGSDLQLNVDCSATGEVWVEVLGEHGQPMPGYSMRDSISVDRNHIAAPVRWREKENVAELAGQPVRLHFKLRACKLYAFQFAPATA